ncbi:MAG: class B sortase [Ruminococcaceae bacterium]|nr:class B sortase [Oscillospiraceae bacterium]
MKKLLNRLFGDKVTVKNQTIILVAASLALVISLICILYPILAPKPVKLPVVSSSDTASSDEPQMLPDMAALYAQNSDIVGWVKIEGTNIDHPLMFTPDDEEKYMYKSFDGSYNINGVPFLDKDCSMEPESDNLIFYGHNMKLGGMFHDLLNYKKESYWKEHPTITFKTLYEERTYEIIGAFKDRVYYAHEDVFKFYQFIDVETEEDFNEAIAYFKKKTPYDMGVEAEYGDRFLTLVTCAYHHKYGRYVVIAREITNDQTTSDPTASSQTTVDTTSSVQ